MPISREMHEGCCAITRAAHARIGLSAARTGVQLLLNAGRTPRNSSEDPIRLGIHDEIAREHREPAAVTDKPASGTRARPRTRRTRERALSRNCKWAVI